MPLDKNTKSENVAGNHLIISGFKVLQVVPCNLVDRPKWTLQVRRGYVFEDLVKPYQDPIITKSQIFRLKNHRRVESSGRTELVPTLNPKWFLTANLPVAIGCILHNIFTLHGIFTTCLSKATMDCPANWQVFSPQKMSYWHRCSISCHKMRGCRKLWKATISI